MAGGSEVCLIVLAIFLPPVAVLLERGCGADFIINILLTLLGHIPGVIHAIYLILHDRERRRNGQLLYPPGGHHNRDTYSQGPPTQSATYPQDNIQPMPPTYGGQTERGVVGNNAPVMGNEKHEYVPATTAPPPQKY